MEDYRLVEYKNDNYYVCRHKNKNGINKLFIVDAEDFDKVLEKEHLWYFVNGHIGYSEIVNKIKHQCFLHDVIMDKPASKMKGHKYAVEHINKNPYDMRKDNLLLTKKDLAKKNNRKCIGLPKDCGIKMKDIPKCVYYCAPRDGHGEMFIIELKINNDKKIWNSSSDENICLKDKLIEIKEKLSDISNDYPEIFASNSIILDNANEKIRLMKQFNNIIKKSKYKCATSNLMKIPKPPKKSSGSKITKSEKSSSRSKTNDSQKSSKKIIDV